MRLFRNPRQKIFLIKQVSAAFVFLSWLIFLGAGIQFDFSNTLFKPILFFNVISYFILIYIIFVYCKCPNCKNLFTTIMILIQELATGIMYQETVQDADFIYQNLRKKSRSIILMK